MNTHSSFWIVIVVLGICAAGAWWYYEGQEAPLAPVSAPVQAPAAEPAAPRFPVPTEMPARERPENLEPLPALDESDQYFELAMTEVFGSGIADLLVDEALIEKIVATVDNLPRAQVADRIKPVKGVLGPFTVDGQDGSAQFTVNPANYERYDFLVNLMATADQEALVDTYRRFYPLFQQAYVNLGYPQGYFNDRLVEVIDHLLLTPEVDAPIELVRPHVLYEYADPELEALSAGQKLMLRTGSRHTVQIKQALEELRARIVDLQPSAR